MGILGIFPEMKLELELEFRFIGQFHIHFRFGTKTWELPGEYGEPQNPSHDSWLCSNCQDDERHPPSGRDGPGKG